jgi:hypothetical protein
MNEEKRKIKMEELQKQKDRYYDNLLEIIKKEQLMQF